MLEKLPDAVGHALRHRRAGLDQIAMQQSGLRQGLGVLTVTSAAFIDHGPIPLPYTADGEGVSPPLQWHGVPPNAQSLLLMVEDADTPAAHPFVHAIVVDLQPGDGSLSEGALTSPGHEGDPALHQGRHSLLRQGWLAPDPPPGHGIHRYAFQLFALNARPAFGDAPGRDAAMEAIREHAIAAGCLIGTYERPDGSIKVGGTSLADIAAGTPGAEPIEPLPG
jgi:Raf kinase inhibitor-like YbhB/YbcL family protein